MTNEERDFQRKLRGLQHAEKIGNARNAWRSRSRACQINSKEPSQSNAAPDRRDGPISASQVSSQAKLDEWDGFTTSPTRTVPTTSKPLTRRSETSYSDLKSAPFVRLGYSSHGGIGACLVRY